MLFTLQTGWSSWCTSGSPSRGWCCWPRRSCLIRSHMSQAVYNKHSNTISLVVPGKDVHAAPEHHLQQLQGGDHHGQHLGHRDSGEIQNIIDIFLQGHLTWELWLHSSCTWGRGRCSSSPWTSGRWRWTQSRSTRQTTGQSRGDTWDIKTHMKFTSTKYLVPNFVGGCQMERGITICKMLPLSAVFWS